MESEDQGLYASTRKGKDGAHNSEENEWQAESEAKVEQE